jgi:glycosyltransferase involved in cell wall biosynthesis
MRFSLIVATRGRVQELDELFASLEAQGRHDVEVIVVDQNDDDRLGGTIARFAARFPLAWRRSEMLNANHARNLGLRLARGAIVAFPDDDCILPPGVLDRVDAAFATDPALQVLTGPAASPAGGLGSGRWCAEAGAITDENVWTSVIEFNLFLRRDLALELGGFDERLGPGTPLGSAEGNDLVLRAIHAGHKAIYDPTLRIIHPDKRLSREATLRAERYGQGLGFVLRRHGVRPGIWLPFFIRPLGGMLVSALRLNLLAMAYYGRTLRGRLAGFLHRDAAQPARLPPLRSEAA